MPAVMKNQGTSTLTYALSFDTFVAEPEAFVCALTITDSKIEICYVALVLTIDNTNSFQIISNNNNNIHSMYHYLLN